MNISAFYSNGNVIMHYECIKGISFNNASVGVKSALLPVICADSGHFMGLLRSFFRIECLLPHILLA